MMRFWDGEWNDDECVIVGVKDMPESVHLGVGCIYPSLDGHSLIPCFFFRKYIVCGNCLVFISSLTKTLSGWCTKWRCPFLSIISLHPNWTLQCFSFQILSSPNVHSDYVLQLKEGFIILNLDEVQSMFQALYVLYLWQVDVLVEVFHSHQLFAFINN